MRDRRSPIQPSPPIRQCRLGLLTALLLCFIATHRPDGSAGGLQAGEKFRAGRAIGEVRLEGARLIRAQIPFHVLGQEPDDVPAGIHLSLSAGVAAPGAEEPADLMRVF